MDGKKTVLVFRMQSREERLMKLAQKTGKKQILNTWIEPCEGEDCCCEEHAFRKFVLPDGTIDIVKIPIDELN
ncbi:hypothetical protein [Bacillus sp. 1P06AnD]|uniref:hypothetical protein n=1 Tax=Bacillus sp. 1P06AnD TaxID=3132208 RepID=UPI0039A229B7